MDSTIIITICILLLFAYVFDITSSKTKIPSVILLLILGWIVKQGATLIDISIPDLTPALPILGTVGLILIVLEGSLELQLDKSKLPFIGKSGLMALLPMLVMSIGLAYAFKYYEGASLKMGLANAIPLSIISSAIAIPSVRYLYARNREFVAYESSLSDIFGVLIFNFITLNEHIAIHTFVTFVIQFLILIVISFAFSIALAFLLSKINHHVKFAPIILLVILVYSISKIYHLPSLIFILLFGIFIGNLEKLKKYKLIQKLQPEILNKEVIKFKNLTTEMTFMIRALFFLLFGFLIETADLLNTATIKWAVLITFGIFIIRYIFLKLFRIAVNPLLYIAPRGLITILLFLSIPVNQTLGIVNKSLIIQVVVLSALVMMFGLMKSEKISK